MRLVEASMFRQDEGRQHDIDVDGTGTPGRDAVMHAGVLEGIPEAPHERDPCESGHDPEEEPPGRAGGDSRAQNGCEGQGAKHTWATLEALTDRNRMAQAMQTATERTQPRQFDEMSLKPPRR